MEDFKAAFMALLTLIAQLLLYGLAVYLLWNGLAPLIFSGIGQLTYWQSVGLLILCRVLFGKVNVE